MGDEVIKIQVVKRSDDFKAFVRDGQRYIWGCGKTQTEAVGDLIRAHASVFKITFSYKAEE